MAKNSSLFKTMAIVITTSALTLSVATAAVIYHAYDVQHNQSQLPNGGAEEKEVRDVASIDKTGSYGLIDEYTIVYTDGSSSTFIVANADSDNPGINAFPSSDGYTPEVKVDGQGNFIVDGVNTGILLDRSPVKDVRSIVSIEKTETNGLIDTYTITYTDDSTSTFLVVNGANGEQGIQGLPGANGVSPTVSINDQGYWVINGEATTFKAVGENGASLSTGHGVPDANQGKVGDTYLDVDSGNLYTKTDAGWGEPIGNNQGASVLVNNGVPGAAQGKVGDTYIDASTGNIYVKGENGWGQPIGNNQGSSFLTGQGEPNADQGKQGDTYMDVTNGKIYTKGDNGWSASIGSMMGPQGPQGPQGPSGTGISVGHGVPNADQGQIGDSYIDVDTGNIYTKDANGWGQPIGNNQGASVLVNNGAPTNEQGKVGDTYIDASTGNVYVKNETGWGEPIGNNQGASFLSGNGEPAADQGKVGDTYMNTTTGEIYQKTDTGWISSGNSIMGPQGPIGISLHTGTGAPSADLGFNQDSYIDTESWNYYVKENNEWVLKGNIHGAAGASGTTPHIGENGHWYIGDQDTGVNATGSIGSSVLTGHGNPNGDTTDPSNPIGAQGGNVGDTFIDLDTGTVYVKDENGWQVDTSGATGIQGTTPHIGDNGNWWIGESDTGISASGPQGQQGQAGASVLTGAGEPAQGLGNNKDSYVDTSTWNYYVKENGAWVLKGNFQGAQGQAGESISVVSCVKTGENGLIATYTITFSNGDTATFDVINGAAGAAGSVGSNGADGHTPVIGIDGTSGNWVIDGVDTGVHAQGAAGAAGAAGAQGDTGNGISNIVVIDSNATETSYRIIFTDGTNFDYTVLNGQNGQNGADGTCMRTGAGVPDNGVGANGDSYIDTLTWDYYVKNNDAWAKVGNIKGQQGDAGQNGQNGQNGVSVTSIVRTSGDGSAGTVDTYTITYSDSTTTTFTVTNGANGAQGAAGTNGNTILVGIGVPDAGTLGVDGDSYIDTNTWIYYLKVSDAWVAQGCIKGDAGEDGVSITSIAKTNTEGLVDTYTITYSNSTTSTFTVTNGQNGNTVLTGNAAPVDQGVDGDSYINLSTWDFYVKENGTWEFKGNIKAASLLTGNGAPSAGNGKVGDSYLDVDTGNVYQKTDTGWGDPIGNIEGANFLTGNGAPAANLGKQGDSYLDVVSGYIYQKSDTGWGDPIGNVKGNNFLTGNGNPAADLGKVGDSYLDIETGKVYTKTDTGWGTEIGNIHQFFDVDFNLNGGTSSAIDTQNIQEGRKVEAPASDPTQDGWIFQGWFTDPVSGVRWDFDKDVVSGDITLYAHWAKFKVVDGVLVECTATGDVIIPEYFDGQLVTAIGDDVFKNNTSITSVTIPYTVTSVGNSAFEGCTGIASIIIPHNVKTLGNDAFKGCSNMAYIYFESVNSTTVSTLRGTSTRSISGLESIGDGAFADTALKAIVLPESVQYIGKGAFSASKGWTIYGNLKDMYGIPDAPAFFVGDYHDAPASPAEHTILVYTSGSGSLHTTVDYYENGASITCYHNDIYLDVTSGNGAPSVDCDSVAFNTLYIDIDTGDVYINSTSQLTNLSVSFVGGSKDNNKFIGYLFGADSYSENVNVVPGTLTNVTIYGDDPIADNALYGCYCINYLSVTGDPEYIGKGAFGGCEGLYSLTLPYIGRDSGSGEVTYSYGNGNPDPSNLSMVYFDRTNFAIWEKINGAWIENTSPLLDQLVANGFIFGEGAPTPSQTGDSYIDYVTGEIYQKLGTSWIPASVNLYETVCTVGGNAYFGYVLGSDNAVSQDHYLPDDLETVNFTSLNGDSRDIVPQKAFLGCFSLDLINLPNNVKEIRDSAFEECYGLDSFVFSPELISIGNRAFYRCNDIPAIVLYEGLKTIGASAFESCSGAEILVIPNSVESIGMDAFRSCSSLEYVSIPFVGGSPTDTSMPYIQTMEYVFGSSPDIVTLVLTGGNGANRDVIPENAFQDMSDLVTISINCNIKTIGAGAFQGLNHLKAVNLPNGVATIGNQAFYGATALVSIALPDSLLSIGDEAFRGCTSLANIALPSNLSSIGERAFAASGLTSIVIPGSVSSIGNDAFNSCTSLTAAVFEAGVEKTIGNRALLGCTSLKTAVINGPIASFGQDVLDGNNALEYVSLGYGITTLENSLFANRTNLKVVVLPESLITIDDAAFQGCTSLKTLNIPYGVTTIGVQAFYGDTALENIVLPNSVTSVGTYSFANNTALKYLTLSESLEEIGIQAFDNCSALEAIYIPASVRTIRSNAFKDCAGLKFVILNEGLQTIHDFAFRNCSLLQTISIPDTVHNMGKGIFYGCSSLSSMTLPFTGGSYDGYGETILTGNGAPDSAVGNDNDLFVDTLNKKIWRKIDGEWYDQFVLGRSDNHQAGTITTGDNDPVDAWTGGEDFYVNLSTGEYFEIDHTDPNNFHRVAFLAEYLVKFGYIFVSPNGMYQIEQFNDTVPTNLKSVSITLGNYYEDPGDPTNFRYYLNYASFQGCSNIETVTLGEKISYISDRSFENCTNLKNITLSKDLVIIDNSVFANCGKLETIVIPNGVLCFGEMAFYNCSLLKYIVFEEGNTVFDGFGGSCFENCISLSAISFPQVTDSSPSAFKNCTSLKSVSFGDNSYFEYGLPSANYAIFEGCTSLETIKMPWAYGNETYLSTFYSAAYAPTSQGNDGNFWFDTAHNQVFYKINGQWELAFTGDGFVLNVQDNLTFPTSNLHDGDCFIGKNPTTNGPEMYVYKNGAWTEISSRCFLYNRFAYFFGSDVSAVPESLANVIITNSDFYNFVGFFEGCTHIKNVILPDNVKGISTNMFKGCAALEIVSIPNGATAIGNYAFDGCTSLKNFNFPASLTSIGDYAFKGCDLYTTLVIPDTITSIGLGAFQGWDHLENIVLPFTGQKRDCQYYDEMHFSYIFGAESYYDSSLYVPDSLKTVVVTVGTHFTGYDNTLENEFDVYDLGSFNEYRIPTYAFYECNKLVSISIPSSIKTIGAEAFYKCSSLASVNFGNDSQLIRILPDAFSYCDSIESIIIPKNVETIYYGAFSRCTGLKAFTYEEGSHIEKLGVNCFYNCPSLLYYIEPESCVNNSVAYEGPIFTGTSSLVALTIKSLEGACYISGNDVNNPFPFSLAEDRDPVSSDYTTYYYFNCDFVFLNTSTYDYFVWFGDASTGSFVKIGNLKFNNDSNIYTAEWDDNGGYNMPTGTFKNGDVCYSYYDNYYNISIQDAYYWIYFDGSWGNPHCMNVKTVGYLFGNKDNSTVPSSLKTVVISGQAGDYTYSFKNCANIETIVIPEGTSFIGNNAFTNSASLLAINMPSTLEYIGTHAFDGCTSLICASLNDGLLTIDDYAFRGCSALETVSNSNSVTVIGDYAFADCTSLKNFNFSTSLKSIGDYAFLNVGSSLVADEIRYGHGNPILTPASKNGNFYIDVNTGDIYTKQNGVWRKGKLTITISNDDPEYDVGHAGDYWGTIYDQYNTFLQLFDGYSWRDTNIYINHGHGAPIVAPYENGDIYYDEDTEDLYFASNGTWAKGKITPFTVDNEDTYSHTYNDDYYIDLGYHTDTDNGYTCLTWDGGYCWYIRTLAGHGAPGAQEGDKYIDLDSGNVFTLQSNNWVLTGNATIGYGVPSIVADGSYYYDSNSGLLYYSGGDARFTSIVIPDSVKHIGLGAFQGWNTLENIVLPFTGSDYAPADPFAEPTHFGYIFGAVDYDSNNTYVPASLKTVVLTKGTFDDYSSSHLLTFNTFNGCSHIKSVSIPDSIEVILDAAFKDCSSLTNVTFGDNPTVELFSNYVFSGCSSLETIVVPKSVQSFGVYTFENCTSLKYAAFADGSVFAGMNDGAFAGCSNLTAISLPDTTEFIGRYAFKNCTSLETVVIPSSVTSMYEAIFFGCTSLKTVSVPYLPFTPAYQNNTQNRDPVDSDDFLADNWIWINTDTGDVWYRVGGDWYKSFNIKNDSSNTIKVTASYSSAPSNPNEGDIWVCSGPYYDELLYSRYTSGNWTDPIRLNIRFLGSLFEEYVTDNSDVPDSLKTVIISNGEHANYTFSFAECSSLETVILPDDTQYIGCNAFDGCDSLKSFIFSDSVETIGESAFANCKNLEIAYFSDNSELVTIGNYAFSNCSSLKSFYIPGDVETIGDSAFSYCDSLQTLKVDGYGIAIGDYAFAYCYALPFINLRFAKTIGDNAFADCEALRNVILESGIERIGDYAFSSCINLESALFLDSQGLLLPATEIGAYAFNGCVSLSQVIFNDCNVTYIGDNAFYGCTCLTSFKVPETVTYIGSGAFEGCTNLESLIVPYAGGSASNIYTWREEDLSSSFTTYGPLSDSLGQESDMFINLKGGENNAELYKKVNGVWTLQNNFSVLTNGDERPEVTGSESDGDYLLCRGVVIRDNPNDNAYYGTLYRFVQREDLYGDEVSYWVVVGEYSASHNSSTIGDGKYHKDINEAFYVDNNFKICCVETRYFGFLFGVPSNHNYRCSHTTKNMPHSLKAVALSNETYIGRYAFENCALIELFTFTNPKLLKGIGDYAFVGCCGFKQFTVPENVTSVGLGAFANGVKWNFDKNLVNEGHRVEITYQEEPSNPNVGDYYYDDGYESLYVYVYDSLDDENRWEVVSNNFKYGAGEPNSMYVGEYYLDYSTGDLYVAQSYSQLETLTVPFVGDGGSNKFFGYVFGASSAEAQAYYVPASLRAVTILGGDIAEKAFYGCANIERIVIPHNVTTIGTSAFEDCSNLANVTFPENGLTTIGARAFYQSGIEIVALENLDSIGEEAFMWCQKLKYVYLSEVNTIARKAFYNTNVEKIGLEDIGSIGDSAFNTSFGLTDLMIEGVNTIGKEAFRSCDNLRSITMYAVNEIGDSAFRDCHSLITIGINYMYGSWSNSTNIGDNAFAGCTTLVDIRMDYIGNIGSAAFEDCRALTYVNLTNVTGTMGQCAFDKCYSLSYIVIGSGITSIGNYAFRDCRSLSIIDFRSTAAITFGTGVFTNCDSIRTVYATSQTNWQDNVLAHMSTDDQAMFGSGVKIVYIA